MAHIPVAVQLDAVSVTYGTSTVLKNISLSIPSRSVVGLIGPSGAGKTTIIRTIIGQTLPHHGTVSVLGEAPGSRKLRQKIAYMSQRLSIYQDLTVEENLRFFARMQNVHNMSHNVAHALLQVGLTTKAHSLVSQLSGGQQQRVSLAVAILGDATLLVLNEPTVGLDPVLRNTLWELFHQLAHHGKTVLVSSHSMEEAGRCDDLILVRDGAVIAHTTPKGLMHSTHSSSVEGAFIAIVEAHA